MVSFSKRLIFTLFLIFNFIISGIPLRCLAQQASQDGLLKIAGAADIFRKEHPVQKLYLQFDKPYYALGDTIWFKAWLFNAAYLTPAEKTGICYVELADRDNKVINRIMLPVARGSTWGSIALNEKEMSGGSYTIRAYTGLMCNFGDDYIFKKNFYFFDAARDKLLVNTRTSVLKDNKGTDGAHINLQFSYLNKEAVVLKQMQLQVTDGKKVFFSKGVQTKVDGSVDLDISLKASSRRLAVDVEEVEGSLTGQKLYIPVTFNRAEDTDVQFMPEGGNLVDGLPAYVGFKAVGEDGKAVEIAGNVFDSKQTLVASFQSAHKGMGVFNMIPRAGENYTVKVTLPGGITKTVALPVVKASGTVLKVRTTVATDSIAVTVTGTTEAESYFLIAQARGIVCYAAVVKLINNAARVKISTEAFPTGVARFSLINAAGQPLNERIIFIDHHDYLHIGVEPNRPSYGIHDSVALRLHITDKKGNSVRGNFSVAVTDDAQVKPGSVKDDNMITNLLLTKDLKGYIEDPAYYFQPDADDIIKKRLDNLLLTQGWTGYDWKDILGPEKSSPYTDEPEFIVSGTVHNVFSKPVSNSNVILLSAKPSFILDTITDKNGRFVFKNIIPVDTPAYILQARNKNGRSFNVDLKVDEFKPPVFEPDIERVSPWYVNNSAGDSSRVNFVRSNIARRSAAEKKLAGEGRLLNEVVINAKKVVKSSQNLNGPGEADIIIDEKELEKAGKKSFLDLLVERVPGFRQKVYNPKGDQPEPATNGRQLPTYLTDGHGIPGYWYDVNGKPLKLVIDGVPIGKVLAIGTFRELDDFLRSHSAEDIKGIELMSSAKYASRYVPIEYAMAVSPSDYSFIEITTRSGHGPVMDYTPGVYLYKPLPFSFPRQFYSPQYTPKEINAAETEYRPTLFWKPDLLTDDKGGATVTFYTSGSKGNYTIIIEGTDGNGNIGSSRSAISVDAK